MQFLRDLLTALKNLAILAGVILGAGYGTASLVQDHLQQSDKLELWLASAAGFAFAFMGGFFGVAIRLLGIPHSIRSVAPRPFRPMRTFLMYSIVVPGNPPQIRHVPRYRPANPRAMSWQQTVAVLLVLFAALPGLFMAYAGGMTPPIRSAGRTMLATSCIAVVLLTIWHFRGQRKKRSDYYAGLSQHFARQQTSSASA